VGDENELQTFCNMFCNLEVIHHGLLTSFTKVSTLPTEVCFQGERTAEFVVVFHLQVLAQDVNLLSNLIVDHCTNVAVLFFLLVDRKIHVIMSSILTLDGFDNFTQFYTKAYGLLHIAIFIAYMSFFIFLDCIFYRCILDLLFTINVQFSITRCSAILSKMQL